ncbi:unnamed protein product [marine sediment metagenome]|uniref:Uncharacterized protein n=1 Tax=marine sediment metagenome TaxID=412755 RepID=X1K8X4_9ZZZZ
MDVSPTIQHLHGRLRSITGTDPAADTEISETVPARRRWRILSIRFSLITDVNVTDRTVNLILDDGTTILSQIPSDTVQPSNLTRWYEFKLQQVPQFNVGVHMYLPLHHISLPASARFRTSTTNRQADDNFSAPQFLVEEWIDP